MAKSQYKIRTAGTLKAAAAGLIEACGGFPAAARIARVGRSQLFRYTDDSEENAGINIPVDVVDTLEGYCGVPAVTEWLAHQRGHLLVPVALDPAGETLHEDVAEIAEHAAKLFAEFARAVKDGRIDKGEAEAMLRTGDAMVREYAHLRPALTARIRGDRG